MMTKNNINATLKIPELRFSEFEDGWSQKKFGDITIKIGSGKTPKGGNEVYQSTGIPFIRSQNVFDDKLHLDGTCISENINSGMKGSTVKPNDILLNITGGSIGRSCVVPKDFKIGNVNQHVCIIRLNKSNKSKFIQSFLTSYKGQKLIFRGQTGSGREGLNFKSIRLFNTFLPSLPEQQKIASFLTAVDQKLAQLAQKKSLLEQYKKGAMQQLFSQELRFKQAGGSDFPDWEEKRLGNLGSLSGGGTPRSGNSSFWQGNIPWISSSDILDNTIHKIVKTRFITQNAIKESATKVISKNSILIVARVGIGKFAVADEDLCTSQDFINLTTNENPYFLAYYFKEKATKFLSLSQGTSIKGFTGKDIRTLKFSIPDIKEQQKSPPFYPP